MKRFNRIIILFVCLLVLVTAAVNILLLRASGASGKYHLIQSNRAYEEIVSGGSLDSLDLEAYDSLTNIDYLPADAKTEAVTAFFETGSQTYIIKTIESGALLGFLKFSYVMKTDQADFVLFANLGIAATGLLALAMLIYVRQRIIRPFSVISELPYELSKGHLTKAPEEHKNRYFGRFVWGLDLLRENLEERGRRELALTKENRMMVLSISHDVKTPLSAIRLYTRALSGNLYEDEDKRQEIIGSIEEKADEIERFVQDIIKTARDVFLHIEVQNGEFYLAELIARLSAYYDDKLTLIKCRFTVDSFANCLIHGDIDRCLEVLENVIENAIKYGDGQEIGISFDTEEAFELITVTNTGNTLPPSETVHMWDSFWRGSNASDKQGSGLGLYICRRMMTEMKGDVYAESGEGKMAVTVVLRKTGGIS